MAAGPLSQPPKIDNNAAAVAGAVNLLRSAAAVPSISPGIRPRHCGGIESLPALRARVVDGGVPVLALDQERPH